MQILELKITNEKNYSFKYQNGCSQSNDTIHSIEEMITNVENAVKDGVAEIRLVGGEPLLCENIYEIIESIKKVQGVQVVELLTNGSLLKGKAKALKASGLDRINISLDTLKYMKYGEIAPQGSLDDIVIGINEAIDADFRPVLITTKIMKNFNDNEILDFLQLTFQHDYEIVFQEPTNAEAKACGYEPMSLEEIKSVMPGLRPIKGQDEEEAYITKQKYKYAGARGKISFSCAK